LTLTKAAIAEIISEKNDLSAPEAGEVKMPKREQQLL